MTTAMDAAPDAGAPDVGATDVGATVPPASLSPSRAGDFMSCPLLYRFRAVERLPEPPSVATARGTLVHAVLERLFDLPPAERTPERALELVDPEWARLLAGDPDLAAVGPDAVQRWHDDVERLLRGYFEVEDPRRIRPSAREHHVEVELDGGLRLRGFIDRLDEAPTGELRIVDYKTGRVPGEAFEGKALFQLKFYALVLWRTRGRVPAELRLIYVGQREMLRYRPDEAELVAFERTLRALWAAIERAYTSDDWRPRRGALCDYCVHQHVRCPEFEIEPERVAAYGRWMAERSARLLPQAEDGILPADDASAADGGLPSRS